MCKTAFKAHAEHSDLIIRQDKAGLSKSTEHHFLKGETDYWDIEGGSGAITIQHCPIYTTFSIYSIAPQAVFTGQQF